MCSAVSGHPFSENIFKRGEDTYKSFYCHTLSLKIANKETKETNILYVSLQRTSGFSYVA